MTIRAAHLTRRALLTAFVASLLAVSLTGAGVPAGKPEDVGMSAERLQRIHQVVGRAMDAKEIAGAVTVVARRGKVAHFEAQGLMDIESKRADAAGRDLPDGVDVEADHRRGDHDAGRRRQGPPQRSGVALHSRVQGHQGRDREARRRRSGAGRRGPAAARAGDLHGAGDA